MNQAVLDKILSEHRRWLKTKGISGKCANLERLDLKKIGLYKVELKKARLCRANLKSSNLGGANLEAADLEGANLQDANLEGANLSSANLAFANLKHANLEMADLSAANLHNANLKQAQLDEATLVYTNFQGANLEKASLFSAEVEDANFIDANLKNALLDFTSLDGACFDGANLTGANFTKAIINDTDLEDLIRSYREDSSIMKKNNIDNHILEQAKSEFIEKIITAVNQEQIKDVVVEKYGIKSINSINIKNGDIISHNSQIAYRLEFETTILLSCILDSDGNLLDEISQISVDSSADVRDNSSTESDNKGDDSIVVLDRTIGSTE
jgi:uncharacterized protein YjbI with pentapeptide repeats